MVLTILNQIQVLSDPTFIALQPVVFPCISQLTCHVTDIRVRQAVREWLGRVGRVYDIILWWPGSFLISSSLFHGALFLVLYCLPRHTLIILWCCYLLNFFIVVHSDLCNTNPFCECSSIFMLLYSESIFLFLYFSESLLAIKHMCHI